MPRYELPVTHRPDREGGQVRDRHVPFHLLLEFASLAWARALASTCEGLLAPSDLAVVNVTSDYRRELFVGAIVFDVTLARFGSSSLTFAIEISQNARPAATVTATLARVDPDRLHSVPLTAEQRTGLERLQLGI